MKQLIYVLILVVVFSCRKDDNADGPVEIDNANVLILNEGNFNFGNASLSLYNDRDNSVDNKIFQSNNNGRPIGDVVQSATQIGDELFVVVNNSSKIEVLNASTLQSKTSIQQLNSPRYIEVATTQKAYVSDLYEDKLYIIDPTNHSVTKTIETKGWIEEMAIANGKLYLTHVDSNQVWVLDSTTDSLLYKIDVHIQPQFIEVDADDNVWVSCSGGFNGGKSALYHIQTSNDSIVSILEGIAVEDKIGEIEMNSTKDELYYIGKNGLYKMSINDLQLPENSFIDQNLR
ncbi:MAG: hypothetical protein QMC40_07525, partial [Vicingaceae bacterium]